MAARELKYVIQHPLTSMTSVERTSKVQSVELMSGQACAHASSIVRNTKNNRISNITTLQNCLIETVKISIFS